MVSNILYKIKLYVSFSKRVLLRDSMDLGHKLEVVRYVFFSPRLN